MSETIDLSCPNGCFELAVSGHHETVDDREFVEESVADDRGPCPNCGAELGGDT